MAVQGLRGGRGGGPGDRPAATRGGGGGLRSAGTVMWRCLSDLGGQSDLWSDVDTRRTGEGSVGARVGPDVPCGTIFVLDFCEYDHSATFLAVEPLVGRHSWLVGEAREVASALYLPVPRAMRPQKCSATYS